MSALGQRQTRAVQDRMSALHPIATAKAHSRKRSSPLDPRKRTCAVQLRMSAKGQKRTHGRQQINARADRSHRERRRIRGSGSLQVGGRLLATLRHYIVGEALTFVKGRHSGAFKCADVHKHVTRAVTRSNESKALLSIEKLDCTCRHGDFPCANAA
jgi:hypothetical protein